MFKKIQAQWLAMQAHLYLQQCKYEPAIILLEAIRILRPHDEHALKSLSFAYLQSQQGARCLACLDILEKLPISATDSKKLKLIKSHAYWSMDKKDEARRFMKEYLAAPA